ncbi:MAG: hypothetical protein Q9181_007492 [Wetmoreana brouardii]
MTACAVGRADLVPLLIKHQTAASTSPIARDLYGFPSPLKLAIHRQDLAVVKHLLQDSQTRRNSHCLDPSLINAAVLKDDAEFLIYMIETDANIDRHYFSDKKALHLACQHRSLKCLGVLIKEGAVLTTLDKSRVSALSYLLWEMPSEKSFLNDLPFSTTERQQVVEAVLEPLTLTLDEDQLPDYGWAYQRAVCGVAHTVLSEPRYFADFVYCNHDKIKEKMPVTLGRPNNVATLEAFTNVLKFFHSGPKPKPLLINRPVG